MKVTHLALSTAALLALAAPGMAAIVDFESFSPGAYVSDSAAVGATDRVFNAAGFSSSTSAAGSPSAPVRGAITGGYNGGNGMTSDLDSATGSRSYIGGYNSPIVGTVSGQTGVMFDLKYYGPTGQTSELAVGGWKDIDTDGRFDQTEAGLMAGVVNGGNLGAAPQFGFRAAGFAAPREGSGVAPVNQNWYRLTMLFDDVNNVASLSVFDLTNNVQLDLNGAAAGVAMTSSAANWGYDSTDFVGLTLRVTRNGPGTALAAGTAPVLDNIQTIPEPASLALLAIGGSLLALRRRA